MVRLPDNALARGALAFIVLALMLVIGASLADGSIGPVFVFGFGLLLLFVTAGSIAVREDVGWLRVLVLGAFALRCGVGAVLVWRSLATGNRGFTTGDDIMFASAAGHVVRYLRGDPELPYIPPDWGGEYFLISTYVYLESVVFWLIGPHVLGMIVLNALFGAHTALLGADTARRIFGQRASVAAGVILAVYPSLVIWSALNLRDTTIIFLVVAAMWALHRFLEKRRFAWIGVALLAAWAEYGLRSYVMEALLIVIVLGVALVPAAPPLRRLTWPTVATVLSIALLAHTNLLADFTSPLSVFGVAEEKRVGLQFGRTAFDTPSPAPTVAPSPGATAAAPSGATPPALVTSVATASLPLVTSGPTASLPLVSSVPTPSVAPVTSVPTPVATAAPATIVPTPAATVPPIAPLDEGLRSPTLAHLPSGVLHALFAPFPWAVGSLSELAAVPEMLLWYVILACLAWTLWDRRALWRLLVPEVLLVGALFLVLALAEGNVGTLFRHRAMLIPSAMVLASPGLAALARRAGNTPVVRNTAARATVTLERFLTQGRTRPRGGLREGSS